MEKKPLDEMQEKERERKREGEGEGECHRSSGSKKATLESSQVIRESISIQQVETEGGEGERDGGREGGSKEDGETRANKRDTRS